MTPSLNALTPDLLAVGAYHPGLGIGGNGLYLLIFFGTLALSLVASLIVRGAYARYSKVPGSSGLTGAELAQRILDLKGIHDVTLHETPGALSDHYDPIHRRLVLSSETFHGRSVAALGIAAHECGHAIQHQQLYAPLQWRMAAVSITNIASSALFWIPLLGMVFHIISFKLSLTIVAVAWGILMLFQLITLPVEFDATARAKRIVPELGALTPGPELNGMNRMLDAAALTYVAAFISALAYFLYYLLRLQGGNRE